jgi:hypothetical protein
LTHAVAAMANAVRMQATRRRLEVDINTGLALHR